MDCDALRDDQWARIRAFVPGGTKGKRGPRTDNRKFLDALLWMARSGGRGVTCRSGWVTIDRLSGATITGSRWACWTHTGDAGPRSRSGMADDR